MTVFDASVKLYGWFSEHDSFCLDTDENTLLVDEDRKKFNKKEEVAAISCALEELKALGMIDCSSAGGKEVWVLKKSFNSMNQTVDLTPETCLSVSTLVNGFCEIIDNETDKVDPKEISEKDIKNLIFVSAYLMDERKKD